ncbi:MAG: adenine phosphoribosyltransferase [Candidatus Sericytochromatia bacterium]|nr:adenine phosphoribosyltransferase [Candidatus Sericytochromatia bacterium]
MTTSALRNQLDRTAVSAAISAVIRDVPDFPKPGILFKDITPMLGHPEVFQLSIAALHQLYADAKLDYIVGIESRGFIFGAPLAIALGAGFVPVRKPGKLPAECHTIEYALEYGTDTLQIHKDAIPAGKRVLIIDDLLATGGTVKATLELVRSTGADVVGAAFIVELSFLNGRERLPDCEIQTLVTY